MMSCDEDELDNNAFFRAIQTSFIDLYEKAQENCYIICVPTTSSILGVSITREFVETQILRRSPYFQGQYLTIHSSKNKTVLFEDNDSCLETGDGFPKHVNVKILSEELAYNKDYKPYKILITDLPFDTSFQSTKKLKDTRSDSLCSPKISFLECKQFLKSFAEYFHVIRELEESIKLFNDNYMVLKDYLDDAAHRLEKITTEATDKCLKCTKVKYYSDLKFRETLSGAVESYVLGSVHQKVFGIICERFHSEDKLMLSKCHQLTGVLPEQLGVRKQFSCSLPTAVDELATMDGFCTPHEKLVCVKAVVDSVTEGVNAYVLENQQPSLHGQPERPCLTSDDLIPIMVTVIAQANCPHLNSDIYYMEHFSWFSTVKDIDSLSYCLVTYKAAVEFMSNTDFQYIQTQSPVLKKDIEELIAATTPLSFDDATGLSRSDTNPSYDLSESRRPDRRSPTSRLDRQLERISHVLQESSDEWNRSRQQPKPPRSIFQTNSSTYQHTPDTIHTQDPSGKQNELGDFLSALQDDDFDMPFGKQT